MQLKGKRIAILVEDQYEDLELWYPYYRFLEEGATVRLVGTAHKDFKSKHSYVAKADLQADEVSPDDFDAVVIPGGYAPDRMRRSKPMVEFVAAMNRQGKPVAAICHAGWMLISAGVVRGRKLTSFHSIQDDLKGAGADYLDQEVVRDGNLITSRSPADLPAFCRTIIATVAKQQEPARTT